MNSYIYLYKNYGFTMSKMFFANNINKPQYVNNYPNTLFILPEPPARATTLYPSATILEVVRV